MRTSWAILKMTTPIEEKGEKQMPLPRACRPDENP
jgi:hypothetical protein